MKNKNLFKEFEIFKVKGIHHIKGGDDGGIGPGDKNKGKDKDKDNQPAKPKKPTVGIPGAGGN